MKTNIFRYAFSLLAVLAAVSSCDKQPEEEQKEQEEVKPVFPSMVINETVAAGQSVDLKFEPNMEWKIEISGEGRGNIFWLDDAGMKATSISGKETGPQVVTIVFSVNEEFDKNRVCDVTLTMGGESKKIATYTRPSLDRTFEVYAGVPGELGFEKSAGAYVYGDAVITETSLATFAGEVTYVLPLKVVTNYAWQMIVPSWVSSEVMSGQAGTTEIFLTAVLSSDIAEGKTEVLKFADTSNPDSAFELELTMPAFCDRIECTPATTFNFDVNGLVENLNGSFIEIPAIFELLSTPQTQIKVLDWNEKGQYYGTSFSQWPQVTKTIYDNYSDDDLLAKYTVEITVGANETYEDKYADIFVIPASKASIALDDWFDPQTGNLKEEYASYIVGRIYQPGLEEEEGNDEVEGEVLALTSGDAEFVKMDEESEMKMFLASEYGQMGELDVYQLTTSDQDVTFTSQVEAWGHEILKAGTPPFSEYVDAPFTFENQATTFSVYMGESVTEPVEALILLKSPGADGVTLLNFAAVYYIYTPSASDVQPEDPGTEPGDSEEESEYDEVSPMIYSIGAGSGTLAKYGTASERYKTVNAKYGLTEVYHLISGDRMVFLSGNKELTGLLQLDPLTLTETSGSESITFEGSDTGFNIYMRGTDNAEALVIVQGSEGNIAAVYVSYDFSIGIPSPFAFTDPDSVEGKATLSRCEGDLLDQVIAEFEPNANFDERNIYQLNYSSTSVKTEITIPSAPVDNAAWNNYPISSNYWLTCKVSGSKMTVTMKKSGQTDYFVFRTTDGNWAWILVCTCE